MSPYSRHQYSDPRSKSPHPSSHLHSMSKGFSPPRSQRSLSTHGLHPPTPASSAAMTSAMTGLGFGSGPTPDLFIPDPLFHIDGLPLSLPQLQQKLEMYASQLVTLSKQVHFMAHTIVSMCHQNLHHPHPSSLSHSQKRSHSPSTVSTTSSIPPQHHHHPHHHRHHRQHPSSSSPSSSSASRSKLYSARSPSSTRSKSRAPSRHRHHSSPSPAPSHFRGHRSKSRPPFHPSSPSPSSSSFAVSSPPPRRRHSPPRDPPPYIKTKFSFKHGAHGKPRDNAWKSQDSNAALEAWNKPAHDETLSWGDTTSTQAWNSTNTATTNNNNNNNNNNTNSNSFGNNHSFSGQGSEDQGLNITNKSSDPSGRVSRHPFFSLNQQDDRTLSTTTTSEGGDDLEIVTNSTT